MDFFPLLFLYILHRVLSRLCCWLSLALLSGLRALSSRVIYPLIHTFYILCSSCSKHGKMYWKPRSFPDSVYLVQRTLLHASLKSSRLPAFPLFSISGFLCSLIFCFSLERRQALLFVSLISSPFICCRPLLCMLFSLCLISQVKTKQHNFPELCNYLNYFVISFLLYQQPSWKMHLYSLAQRLPLVCIPHIMVWLLHISSPRTDDFNSILIFFFFPL